MNDVTIPADVAKRIALVVRQAREVGLLKLGDDVDRWTALLDPPPPLREKVRAVVSSDVEAVAVLAVIADEMAKRPLLTDDPPTYRANPLSLHHRSKQRDADVAWLRGKSPLMYELGKDAR